MNVLNDKDTINLLKKKLNSYINDIGCVKINTNKEYLSSIDQLGLEDDWVYKIQYLTEHALIKYSKIDLLKENFLSCNIDYMQQEIKIRLNNLKCSYRRNDVEIVIRIPVLNSFNFKGDRYYKLSGNIKIDL